MPTYEYECQACGHAFEEFQAMTAAKLTRCPRCHKKKLTRLISSGSGVIFKGSGFYVNDYKKKPALPCEHKDSPKDSNKHSAPPCAVNCPHASH